MTYTLTIVPTDEPHGTMMTSRVHDAQRRLVFATRAYSTPEGEDGARAQLRALCKKTGHKLVMAPAEQRKRA